MFAGRPRKTHFLRGRAHAHVLVLFLILAGTCQIAQAVDAMADDTSPRYTFRRFQTDSGLPESTVLAMAQTPDGYIWCATFNGLARFDGVRFVNFDPSNTPELPTDRVTRLGVMKSGALVVVTEFGDVLVRSNGQFQACPHGNSHRNEGIIEDGAGRLWTSSLERAASVVWSPLDHDGAGGMKGPLSVVIPLIMSTHSGPWIVDGNTTYMADEKGIWKAKPSGRWEDANITVAGEQATGFMYYGKYGPWLVTSNFYCLCDRKTVVRKVNKGKIDRAIRLLSDEVGNLWLVCYRGPLYHCGPHEDTFSEVITLPSRNETWIPCLFLDKEQNVWVSMASDGLAEVQRAPMQCFSEKDGLVNNIVRTVAEDHAGNIWVCGGGGVTLLSNQVVSTVIKYTFFWSVVPRAAGGMWMGSYGGDGLFIFEHGETRPAPGVVRSGWEAPYVNFLFTDSVGELWFGNDTGLYRYDGTESAAIELPTNGRVNLRAFAEARDGTLYAGSNGQGLFVRDKTTRQWHHFGRADGLQSEQIYSLHAGSAGNLWIGTSGAGVARFDGRNFVFYKPWINELPRTVTGIEEDDLGYLWLGSTSGIFRVKLSELTAIEKNPARSVSVTEYGRSSGLLSAESVPGVQPSVAKCRDGRIWFATTGGVASFDPREIPVNPRPPPVAIESVSSGDFRLDLSGAPKPGYKSAQPLLTVSRKNPREIIASAGTDPIEFEFTGLSFTAPEHVRFRYWMEGLEDKWTGTLERKVVYRRLPPGHYTFHVCACNNDGVWNSTGAALAIVQLPFYWETDWFKLSIMGAIALAIYAAYRYRLAQLARVGRLRARIAADLHDEVGSNMGAVVLNSDLLTMSPNLSAPEREQIEDIHRVARNTAQAVREISWFINPDFDFLDQMVERMKETAGRLSRNFDLQFTAPDNAPKTRLSLEFRRNVMAIYKEALNNAAKHSGAKRIEVSVEIDSRYIDFLICDDGRGFCADQESSGQGMRNLRQRAAALKGQLDIKSKPGEGTTVRLKAVID